jgi:cytochrome b subunit of formate dehydrogenase
MKEITEVFIIFVIACLLAFAMGTGGKDMVEDISERGLRYYLHKVWYGENNLSTPLEIPPG